MKLKAFLVSQGIAVARLKNVTKHLSLKQLEVVKDFSMHKAGAMPSYLYNSVKCL